MSIETLPASPETAELYLTFVALSTESVAAAVSEYAAIYAFQEVKGLLSHVKSLTVKMLLEGIRRSFGKPAVQSDFLSLAQTGGGRSGPVFLPRSVPSFFKTCKF